MILKILFTKFVFLIVLCCGFARADDLSFSTPIKKVRFAAFGDYGSNDSNEARVTRLVKSWNPDFIITLGDNNYDGGGADTIDANIGKYYHGYIGNYMGKYGVGSKTNRFFPSLGNHDWESEGAKPYLNYFTLPNNERYYDFTWGALHFFCIDSDPHEPHGISKNSRQGKWLKSALASSSSKFKLVYFHHSPYSSGKHGSHSELQWPFKNWGADVILSGHDHSYERLNKNGTHYIIVGTGGRSLHSIGSRIQGSKVRYDQNYGALLGTLDGDVLTLEFYSLTNSSKLIDRVVIEASDAITSSPLGDPSSALSRLQLGIEKLNEVQLELRNSSNQAILTTKKIGILLSKINPSLDKDPANCTLDLTTSIEKFNSLVETLNAHRCSLINKRKCLDDNILDSFLPKINESILEIQTISQIDLNNDFIADACLSSD